jgi:hypothetical protein
MMLEQAKNAIERGIMNEFGQAIEEHFGMQNNGWNQGYNHYGNGYNQMGGYGQQQQWGPKLNTKEVCCMEGMECWDSSYANTQGKAGLEDELKMLEADFPGVQGRFDELNVDNLKKAAAEREQSLADARQAAKKLNNKIGDANKRVPKLQAALDAA